MQKLSDYLPTILQNAQVVPGQHRPISTLPAPAGLCVPDCPECGGDGWIRYDAPIGHALFGKIFPCPSASLEHPYYDRFGLGRRERMDLTWASIWDEDNALEGVEAVKSVLARGSGLVFLWGDNGKAKTLMLKAAVAETLRARKGGGVYANMANLIDELRACFDEPNPGKAMADRVEHWASIPVLALDEFDFIRTTEFAQERQFLLLDKRYEAAMAGMDSVTLMASNSAPEALPRRLYDRIRDGRNRIVHLEGESLRPGLGWESGNGDSES
jgi:DNA replication protein DnaC